MVIFPAFIVFVFFEKKNIESGVLFLLQQKMDEVPKFAERLEEANEGRKV